MPYRRLPNTDSARLRAMERALRKADGKPPYELACSVSTYQSIKNFYPEFKQSVLLYKEAIDRQTNKSKVHGECFKKAKLYISHFIQVLNFAIIRGELKPDTRKIFGLDMDECKLPQLTSEKDVIEWGNKLINGEQQRTLSGLAPITNPNIARVKVHFEEFLRIHQSQKYLQESNTKSQTKVTELRKKADDLILNLWNEVEETYSNHEADDKRKKSAEYGVVYVYRKNEKLTFANLKFLNVT